MKRSLLTYALLLLAFVAGAQQRAFTVGQYNIRYDEPNDAKRGNGWEQRAQHVRDIIYYEWWDLVGLQEVLDGQLETLKAGLSEYDFIGVARDDGKKAGEYAPILYKKSRMRCLQSGTFWLSETPDKVGSIGWDAAAPRICTWAQFEDKNTKWKFWMFNLHMDHIGTKARSESAKLVIKKIKEMCGEEPYILTGDFNVDQHNEIYGILTAPGAFTDALTKTNRRYVTNGTTNAFHSDKYSDSRIDHIFISDRFYVYKYGILTHAYWNENGHKHHVHWPSDHFAVAATLELPHLRSPEDWANYRRYAKENIKDKDKDVKVVFMGNSITEGWRHHYPEFFQKHEDYICRGIGGQVTAQMLARFRPDVIDHHPEKVVILAGTNDIAMNQGFVALEHIYGNIISMAELALANGIKPYLCSILPGDKYSWSWEIDTDRAISSIATINKWLREYCEKTEGVEYVDYFTPMADENAALKKEYQRDPIHPNKAGYLVMEKILDEALNK